MSAIQEPFVKIHQLDISQRIVLLYYSSIEYVEINFYREISVLIRSMQLKNLGDLRFPIDLIVSKDVHSSQNVLKSLLCFVASEVWDSSKSLQDLDLLAKFFQYESLLVASSENQSMLANLLRLCTTEKGVSDLIRFIFHANEEIFQANLRYGFADIVAVSLIKHFNGDQKMAEYVLSNILKNSFGVDEFERLLSQSFLEVFEACINFAGSEPGSIIESVSITSPSQNSFSLLDLCLDHITSMFKCGRDHKVILKSPAYLIQLLLLSTERIRKDAMVNTKHSRVIVHLMTFWTAAKEHKHVFLDSWIPILQATLFENARSCASSIVLSQEILKNVIQTTDPSSICYERCILSGWLTFDTKMSRYIEGLVNFLGTEHEWNFDEFCIKIIENCVNLSESSKLYTLFDNLVKLRIKKGLIEHGLRLKTKFTSICQDLKVILWLNEIFSITNFDSTKVRNWHFNDLDLVLHQATRTIETSIRLEHHISVFRVAYISLNSNSCQKAYLTKKSTLSTENVQNLKDFLTVQSMPVVGRSIASTQNYSNLDEELKRLLNNSIDYSTKSFPLFASLVSHAQGSPIWPRIIGHFSFCGDSKLFSALIPRLLWQNMQKDSQFSTEFCRLSNEHLESIHYSKIRCHACDIISQTVFTGIYRSMAETENAKYCLPSAFDTLSFDLLYSNISFFEPEESLMLFELRNQSTYESEVWKTKWIVWLQTFSKFNGEYTFERTSCSLDNLESIHCLLFPPFNDAQVQSIMSSSKNYALWVNQQWELDDISTKFHSESNHCYENFKSQYENYFIYLMLRMSANNERHAEKFSEEVASRIIDNVEKNLNDSLAAIIYGKDGHNGNDILDFTLKAIKCRKKQIPVEALYPKSLHFLKTICESDKGLDKISSVVGASRQLDNDLVLRMIAGQSCAKYMWKNGFAEASIDLLHDSILKLSQSSKDCNSVFAREQASVGWLRLSKWLLESNLEHPSTIMVEYLDKARSFLAPNSSGETPSSSASPEIHAKIVFSLARLNDQQYEMVLASDTISKREKLLRVSRSDLAAIRQAASTLISSSSGPSKEEVGKALSELENQYRGDKAEYERAIRERDNYAISAMDGYLKALSMTNRYDMHVFRLSSLWLSNRSIPMVNSLMKQYISTEVIDKFKVPSYKFLPLIYQLAARLDVSFDERGMTPFQNVLEQLLFSMASQHPYHTIYQILSLKNSSMNPSSQPISTGSSSKRKIVADAKVGLGSTERRAYAANSLLTRLRSSDAKLAQRIHSIEMLCSAYSELASYSVDPDSGSKKNITSIRAGGNGIKLNSPYSYDMHLQVRKISNLSNVPVPTRLIPIDPTGEYLNCVTVVNLGESYHLIGGINLPKVIDCYGSDGKRYRQLVKGKDDVRQVLTSFLA